MPEDYPDDYPMNPFWFVPMDDQAPPALGLGEWGIYDAEQHQVARSGDLLTGRIRVRIRALTPLHVAGKIEARPGGAMLRRYMYRRLDANGSSRPVVEGSSLRGMVRAYVEALTNGTASVYNRGHESGIYAKQMGKRHVGFWIGPKPTATGGARNASPASTAFESTHQSPGGTRYTHGDREGQRVRDQPSHVWLPERLATSEDGRLRWVESERLDPATVLFGLVTLDADTKPKAVDKPKAKDQSDEGVAQAPTPRHALGGRVTFEDAWFGSDALEWHDSLDLDAPAAMGGPKPSLSNWWYFKPDHFRTRHGRLQNGRPISSVEFIGGQLRGRKFYFHQDPTRCVQWYKEHWQTWQPKIREVPTETVPPGQASDVFHVHFRELPVSLVKLLLVALAPSARVRHKLGALRPFGFGSVELEVDAVQLRTEGPAGLDLTLGDGWEDNAQLTAFANSPADDAAGQDQRELAIAHGKDQWLVNERAWSWLRLISHWPVDGVTGDVGAHRIFAYPPYRQPRRGERLDPLERGFALPVSPNQLARLKENDAAGAIGALWSTKRAIDMDWWQMNAWNYEQVKKDSQGG